MAKSWPAWFYGPNGEAEVFERKDDVPAGWTDSPQEKTDGQAEDQKTPDQAEPGDNLAVTIPPADATDEQNTAPVMPRVEKRKG
jgi:hypothetical protein